MAFATQNVKRTVFGNMNVTYGDWTGSAGDANGTFTVYGGRVYLMRFDSQDSNNGPDQEIPCFVSSTSNTSSTITVSMANRQTTVSGRFLIIHG